MWTLWSGGLFRRNTTWELASGDLWPRLHCEFSRRSDCVSERNLHLFRGRKLSFLKPGSRAIKSQRNIVQQCHIWPGISTALFQAGFDFVCANCFGKSGNQKIPASASFPHGLCFSHGPRVSEWRSTWTRLSSGFQLLWFHLLAILFVSFCRETVCVWLIENYANHRWALITGHNTPWIDDNQSECLHFTVTPDPSGMFNCVLVSSQPSAHTQKQNKTNKKDEHHTPCCHQHPSCATCFWVRRFIQFCSFKNLRLRF